MTNNSTAYPSGLHYQGLEEYLDAHAIVMARHRAWIQANQLAFDVACKTTTDKKQQESLRKKGRSKHFETLEPQYVADATAIKQHKEKVLSQWREFAQQNTDKLEDINLLHDIAFKQEYIKEAAEMREVKSRIEPLCLAISNFTHASDKRELLHISQDALVEKWIELEKEMGLYPPQPLNKTKVENRSILEKRKALLATPKGALLGHMLWQLNSDLIAPLVVEVQQRLKRGSCPQIIREEVYPLAYSLFIACLFTHDNKKSGFYGHLYTNLSKGLCDRVATDQKSSKPATFSLDTGTTDDDVSPHNAIAGPDARTPDKVIANLQLEKLLNCTDLNANERRVLEMRFGLNGQAKLTLEEAGNRLGLTRERARQIEVKALEKLQAAVSRGFVAKIAVAPPDVHEDLLECRAKLRELLLGKNEGMTIAKLSRESHISDAKLSLLIGGANPLSLERKGVITEDVRLKLAKHLTSAGRPDTDVAEFNRLFTELRELTDWQPRSKGRG